MDQSFGTDCFNILELTKCVIEHCEAPKCNVQEVLEMYSLSEFGYSSRAVINFKVIFSTA